MEHWIGLDGKGTHLESVQIENDRKAVMKLMGPSRCGGGQEVLSAADLSGTTLRPRRMSMDCYLGGVRRAHHVVN
jgi:hypothetical protein